MAVIKGIELKKGMFLSLIGMEVKGENDIYIVETDCAVNRENYYCSENTVWLNKVKLNGEISAQKYNLLSLDEREVKRNPNMRFEIITDLKAGKKTVREYLKARENGETVVTFEESNNKLEKGSIIKFVKGFTCGTFGNVYIGTRSVWEVEDCNNRLQIRELGKKGQYISTGREFRLNDKCLEQILNDGYIVILDKKECLKGELNNETVEVVEENTAKVTPATETTIEVAEQQENTNVEYTVTESTHTKTGATIYLVSLNQKVSKEEFKTISDNIKSLGGYWSRFTKTFIIADKEKAYSLLTPVAEEIQEVATEGQTIEQQENNDLTIKIISETHGELFSTTNINTATLHLNKIILEEQKTNFGYAKTCITLEYNNNSYYFNYDINGKISLQTDIIEFILNSEREELERLLKNDIKNYLIYREIEDIKNKITILEKFISKNTIEPETTQKAETIETIDNTKLVIFVEGEGCIKEITTNNIQVATENFNARIINEYNETCGGYSKTWITLTYKDNSYRFRYDLDNKTNLATNIIQFMIEQETQGLNYTLANREKFSSYMNIDSYEEEQKQMINILNDILQDNNEVVEIKENPYTEAIEQIEESNLYILNPSHDWLLKDNRLIRNDYMNAVIVATGKAVKEFISEGAGISPFNLKEFTGNLNAFKEGLRKCDNGNLITLFPTKQDQELKNIKMLDRFKKELERIS